MNWMLCSLTLSACASLAAAELHPSLIPVGLRTSSTFRISDPDLQGLHDRGMKLIKGNLKEFAPGMEVLVEGGGYDNAWLETQPMGGEMYVLHHPQVALNNQVLFLLTQRRDGRLPGMVLPGRTAEQKGWGGEAPFPAGYLPVPRAGLIADYEMFQGYCFPEPAWRMNFWIGGNEPYLRLLATALEGHDAYLWRTRDSNADGLLETWCVWDTGEDGSTRLHQRGAKENWPYEQAPGSGAPGLPEMPEHSRMPFQSMDVMAYSYSGRAVLAKIHGELGELEKQKSWQDAAEEVRRRVIDKLWDPKRHACFDRDRDGKVLPELIHNNLRCMWFGLFTQEMADAFIRHHLLNPDEFWTPVPLVSIARNEELFLSKPRNNWSGQPQGLTYQRALHALGRYGHHAEVTLLGRKLLPVLVRNDFKFSQQLHEETGVPSLSNSDGYGPMILAMEGYLSRMHGIHIDPAEGEIWWSGLEPEGGSFTHEVEWGDRRYQWSLDNGVLKACVNGKQMFVLKPGIRVVTDLEGMPRSVVGIDTKVRHFQLPESNQKTEVAPNQVLSFTDDRNDLRVVRSVPFDYPYRKPTP